MAFMRLVNVVAAAASTYTPNKRKVCNAAVLQFSLEVGAPAFLGYSEYIAHCGGNRECIPTDTIDAPKGIIFTVCRATTW